MLGADEVEYEADDPYEDEEKSEEELVAEGTCPRCGGGLDAYTCFGCGYVPE